ncbi:hypothetical protein ACTMTI_24545 [Nonomuraea sp. H19]
MHKDINSGNIRRPSLIDFGLATTFAEELPGFAHENLLVGTSVSMAPE